MKIYFIKAERSTEEFFFGKLDSHDVRYVGDIGEVAEDAEVISVFIDTPVGELFLSAHPRVKLIAARSNSVEHIDLAACRARGIVVCAVPQHGVTTVAEHTFALILALSRRLREVMAMPKGRRFSYEGTRGFDLAGKTLGIVGMGGIGQRVAALAHGFAMEVIATDHAARPDLASELNFRYVPFEELLARSHVISLHANLTAETFHLIDASALAKCRRGVLIINTARGALLDTRALRDALESGHVGGAGLDVLEDERVMRTSATDIISSAIVAHLRSDVVASEAHDADRLREMQELILGDELLARTNVVFTPHVAFNSVETVAQLRRITLENIEAFVAGMPQNVV